MADATFTVNGSAVTGAVAVTAGSTVNLAVVDTTGVRATIDWKFVGNHSSSATNPTITKAGVPLGSAASFSMPAGSNQSYLLQCTIDGGTDVNGRTDSSATYRAVIGVVNDNDLIPACYGEEFARNATHGTTELFNEALNLGYSDPSAPDAESSQLAVTGNATRTVGAYYEYDPSLSNDQSVNLGIYVHMSQTGDVQAAGCATCNVVLRMVSGSLEFGGGESVGAEGPAGSWNTEQLFHTHDADLSIVSNVLRVNIYAIEATSALARVRIFVESSPVTWSYS